MPISRIVKIRATLSGCEYPMNISIRQFETIMSEINTIRLAVSYSRLSSASIKTDIKSAIKQK